MIIEELSRLRWMTRCQEALDRDNHWIMYEVFADNTEQHSMSELHVATNDFIALIVLHISTQFIFLQVILFTSKMDNLKNLTPLKIKFLNDLIRVLKNETRTTFRKPISIVKCTRAFTGISVKVGSLPRVPSGPSVLCYIFFCLRDCIGRHLYVMLKMIWLLALS